MSNKEQILEPRRAFLFDLIDVAQKKGLEIGPLTSPLVTSEDIKKGGEIFYLDHLSTAELRKKYRNDSSVSIDAIQDVDFICPDGDFTKVVNGKKFDYIIAMRAYIII